jgi:hypothetical protein
LVYQQDGKEMQIYISIKCTPLPNSKCFTLDPTDENETACRGHCLRADFIHGLVSYFHILNLYSRFVIY